MVVNENAQNRGLWIYLGLVVCLALLAWGPFSTYGFQPVKIGGMRQLAPLTGPIVSVVGLGYVTVGQIVPRFMSRAMESALLLGLCLVYYAFALSPIGAALVITKGRLRETWRRTFWIRLQLVYLVIHAILAYGGFLILKEV